MKKKKDFIKLDEEETNIVYIALDGMLCTMKHLEGDFYWEEFIAKKLKKRIDNKIRKEFKNEKQ